jgi:HSP20 family molecular chaperone IbpA
MSEIQLQAVKGRSPDMFERGYDTAPYWDPRVHVRDKGSAIVAEVLLPGIESKKLHVFIEDDRIRIAGSRGENTTHRSFAGIEHDYWYESFQELVAIPKGVEKDKVSAVLKDGSLTVIMPKCAHKRNAPGRSKAERSSERAR